MRRIISQEIERPVGEYNQSSEPGDVYAMDGKAVRGMRKKEEEGNEYLLSVYDVGQAEVMSQVEVGRKENEITKAPKALKLAEMAQKVVTGAALHTQRGLAAQILEGQGDYVFPVKENQPQLYKNIQSLFAPEYPKPGFGKIQTDFLNSQKVNKGQVVLKFVQSPPVKCSIRRQRGQAWHRFIVWSVNSSGGVRKSVIVLLMNSNSALSA